jgi:hypothetical protein
LTTLVTVTQLFGTKPKTLGGTVLELSDQRARRVLPGQKVLKVHKDLKEIRDQRARRVKRVQLVLKGLKEILGLLDRKALKVFKVKQVQRVTQEQPAPKDPKATPAWCRQRHLFYTTHQPRQ